MSVNLQDPKWVALLAKVKHLETVVDRCPALKSDGGRSRIDIWQRNVVEPTLSRLVTYLKGDGRENVQVEVDCNGDGEMEQFVSEEFGDRDYRVVKLVIGDEVFRRSSSKLYDLINWRWNEQRNDYEIDRMFLQYLCMTLHTMSTAITYVVTALV